MKRKKIVCMAVACICLAALAAFAAQMMTVQVRDGQIRSTPCCLGKIVGRVSYGQAVSVIDTRGDWSHVSSSGVKGWVHVSALTTADLGLRSGSGQAPSSVSGQEMALAGKGFNAQVEQKYRQAHGGDYASVDRMERATVPPERLMAFLKEGGVSPRGGM